MRPIGYALLFMLIWVVSGVVFSHFHECKCPPTPVEKVAK